MTKYAAILVGWV